MCVCVFVIRVVCGMQFLVSAVLFCCMSLCVSVVVAFIDIMLLWYCLMSVVHSVLLLLLNRISCGICGVVVLRVWALLL